MTSGECTVRRHQLERLEVGELLGDEAASLRAHTQSCASCTARLAGLSAERAAFLASVSPAIESARILERAASTTTTTWRGLRWLAALIPVAATLLLIVARDDAGVRTKGANAVHLSLFVNRPDGPVLAEPGSPLRAGDQIQFRYAAAGHRYVYVVSVDGRRAITSLYPSSEGTSVPIEPGGDRILPGSIILDDALGPERVFAFFSETPLTYAEVQAAVARGLADGDLQALDRVEWAGEGLEQTSTWFLKVP